MTPHGLAHRVPSGYGRLVKWTVVAIVSILGLSALVVGCGLLFIRYSVPNDPMGRGYVERRPDGLWVSLRACGNIENVTSVEVRSSDATPTKRPPVLWSAKASSGRGAPAVRLFAETSGFKTKFADGFAPAATYDIEINPEADDGASVVLVPAELRVGWVAYDGVREPTTLNKYQRMSNKNFGCYR